ncbi:MAG: flagellar biosynthesis protein FlhG [Candidatus Magnetoglobus multicellularis str. Araruama]|uniref:Flagellar biosynthesis protein FlhG n=1 Tax=Candidatus Magnetoglobus multicellularis str. Araruama TaxID=890399 RepID=A0A1V1P4Z1_9BACT|nr:MAG: flagellar biosynthesis protein FlhG [Candidatus Magnetoglobus multicellularis str. Araruama]
MDQASGLRNLIQKYSKDVWELKQNARTSSKDSGPRVIAVTSGKGGVGKTNVVGNLAIAFSQLNKKVIIFDGDLGLANIDVLLGIRSKFNIHHVISGEKNLADIIETGPENIKIIPGGSGLQQLSNLTEGERLLLLNEFDSLDQDVDIFLIDTGAGISTNITYLNMAAEERIVISTPEPTSITDAYAMIKVMYQQHGTKEFELLVNMARSQREAEAVFNNIHNNLSRFLKDIQLVYLGYIARDDHIQKSVRRQIPVVLSYPKSTAGKQFAQLARKMLDASQEKSEVKTLSFFWKKFMSNLKL